MTTTTPEAVAALKGKLAAIEPRWHPCGKTTMVYRNPDGPKAADTLTALTAERDALAERVKVLEGALCKAGFMMTETHQ